jgi:hypothetical protein
MGVRGAHDCLHLFIASMSRIFDPAAIRAHGSGPPPGTCSLTGASMSRRCSRRGAERRYQARAARCIAPAVADC